MRNFSIGIVLCIMTLLSGCKQYRAEPLVPTEVVAAVSRLRQAPIVPESSGATLTLQHTVELMKTYSPALREAEAEYQTALALAKVKTPLHNPAVEAGPKYAFGRDVTSHRWAPFGSIGFTIPIGGRLKRQDELNRMQAERALAEVSIRNRELYLQLRQIYSRLALTRAQLLLRKNIAESAAKSLELSQKRVDVGEGTSLDVGIMRLESVRSQTEVLVSESAVNDIEGALAELVGVSAAYLRRMPEAVLPTLPATIPSDDALLQLLVCNQPQLARLRLAYEVAERELRLEIARQYPDFQIGPSYDRETGEVKHTLGLTLGIELPIFNRNQQAIATASKRREEIRAKYVAAASRSLAQLERAEHTLSLTSRRLKLLVESQHPQAKQNLELARKSIEVGTADTLQLLETERGERNVALQLVETELALREAWIAVEQAVGCPLLSFPGESAEKQQPDPEPIGPVGPREETRETAPENN